MAPLQGVYAGCGGSVALVVVLPTSGLPHGCARPMPGAAHPRRHAARRAEQGRGRAWGATG